MLPAEKKFFIRRVQALKKRIDGVEDGPSLAVKALLSLWQKEQFPLLCEEASVDALSFSQDDLVVELVRWLAARPFLESTFWLSSAYAIWVGNETRSEKSLYFTPPILAERLIDNLISHGASLTNHTWIDPACGGGAFLAPLAVRMVNAMIRENVDALEIIKKVSKNLHGNDIDATLAYLSTQFLLMALYKQFVTTAFKPRIKISTGNGLLPTVCEGEKADVIICNPPYRKMKAVEVREYADAYADIIEGQPNIYALFIRQCLKIGRPGALIGLLTPTSYLSGTYFSKLRSVLLENTLACQLDLVDDRDGVFIGVSQGAVLSLYCCNQGGTNGSRKTEVCALSITGKFTEIGSCELKHGTGAWAIPRQRGDQEIIEQAAGSPYRLIDFGYSARVGTYVDYRDNRKTYTREPNNKKMQAVFPLIWSSDITTDGHVIHGRTSKQDGHHTFIEMGTKNHIAVIRNPAIALQRVTSPDQPRRLVCAPIDEELLERYGGVVGENHVIFLEQISDACQLSPQLLAKILGSETVDRLFRSISGAVNVSVSELNQLSLPNPKLLLEFLERGYAVDQAVVASFKQTTTSQAKLDIKFEIKKYDSSPI